jgi:3-methylcrotonyl-CoA carboxylase alpha subunit
MGSKTAAKQIMERAGVPLVPGYHGDDQDPELLRKSANDMGYPVLLKAAAGGGGKGMRQVWSPEEFDDALAAAKRESMSSFNDDKMLVEKYLTEPRHIEIQVFCDNHKQGVYLFERDCSIQRRHQKVIEEAPAPGLSQELREKMGEAALKAAYAINYSGAGTVEFLFDTDGSFYFMEMNTRLQVEHPVTEMITGEDLVEWQIRVANNEVLPKTQQQLLMKGHSFEARVYAEDPENHFLPATGTLSLLKAPRENQYVRVDTGVEQGDDVSIYYDPMIAKLIVWDESREKALARLSKSLGEYAIGGVVTNIDYLQRISQSTPFKNSELTTDFIERHEALITPSTDSQSGQERYSYLHELALYSLLVEHQQLSEKNTADGSVGLKDDPWSLSDNYRSNLIHTQQVKLAAIGEELTIDVQQIIAPDAAKSIEDTALTFTMQASDETAVYISGELKDDELVVLKDGCKRRYFVMSETVDSGSIELSIFTEEGIVKAELRGHDLGDSEDTDDQQSIVAPMNGTVVDLLVSEGEKVEKGKVLIIVEAMKMEHAIKAPYAGVVKECYFATGDLVNGGVALLDIEADADDKSEADDK